MSNYVDDAHRTLSEHFYSDKVNASSLTNVLKVFIQHAQLLDEIKRTLYYGTNSVSVDSRYPTLSVALGEVNREDINLIHGIIGCMTESCELAEVLLSRLEGKDFDLVNVSEEVGDLFWYQALISKATNESFESIQNRNINKLRQRFPDKFDENSAVNRDLISEREVLEK